MDVIETYLEARSGAGVDLSVRVVHETTCFVAMPSAMIPSLFEAAPDLPLVLQLRALDRESGALSMPSPPQPQLPRPGHPPAQMPARSPAVWYVAWAGAASSGPELEVPSALAELISLPAATRIRVLAKADVPPATSVTVDPLEPDDWEMVSCNAETIEDQLLNQTGIAAVGQAFPFWVGRHRPLRLKVTAAAPAGLVRLVRSTELIVAPNVRRHPAQSRAAIDGSSALFSRGPQHRLRVQASPLPPFQLAEGWTAGAAWEVCISSKTAEALGRFEEGTVVLLTNNSARHSTVATITLAEGCGEGHVGLSRSLREQLRAATGARITVCSLSGDRSHIPAVTQLYLHPQSATLGGSSEDGSAAPNEQDQAAAPHSEIEIGSTERAALASAGVTTSPDREENADASEASALVRAWTRAQLSRDGALPGMTSGRSEKVLVLAGGSAQMALRAASAHSAARFTLRWAAAHEDSSGGNVEHDAAIVLALDPANLPPIQLASPMRAPPRLGGSAGEALGPGPAPALAAHHREAMAAGVRSSSSSASEVATQALARLKAALAPSPSSSVPPKEQLDPTKVSSGSGGLDSVTSIPLGGILLHGSARSGLTALMLGLASEVRHDAAVRAAVVALSGAALAALEVRKAREKLMEAASAAVARAPSVLLLDDLHLLVPAGSGGAEDGPSVSSADALAEYVADLLDGIARVSAPVAVVATARAPEAVAAAVRSAGRLDLWLALPAPGGSGLADELEAEAKRRGIKCAVGAAAAAAAASEGYDRGDAHLLLDRAIHAASARLLLRSNGAASTTTRTFAEIAAEDFEKAREGFVPASMRGLTGGSDMAAAAATGGADQDGWSSLGGLAEAKLALREALELPSKHAALFAGAPLRLRTGCMLFGPPGCGKTIAARAAAAACGLRLISVKGPELLNKYIGQSEAGVRALFQRATAAAPCVLFFDEFDALAPRRGHDSTGVTDRVVNQLLTELDGVEGLKGVSVLAATSRPDLVDPALLRPGRLDRLVYCNLPTEAERESILRALATPLRLAPDVRFATIAAATDNFTGADLSALLADAQLVAVHTALESAPDSAGAGAGAAAKAAVISAAALESAASAAAPSLAPAERERLDRLYANFTSARTLSARAERQRKGKAKATLA
mmetsp:Transcript_8161/g.27103  ORF Transcript_8161/g.27103 Transcript_8161/m.27103 type:complete len:1145 (+) Transcript_8161:499-3933(+)